MRKLITIILFFIAFKSYSQLLPAPSGTLTTMSTNQAYLRLSDSTYYVYNGTTYKWQYLLTLAQANKLYAPISGGSYVPTSRTLTINGTAFDLSANRTWNVGITNITGLSDSLLNKANRNFNNVASGAIANSKLANSSLTIGSTNISLGATSASLTGLTSVGLLNSGFTTVLSSSAANTNLVLPPLSGIIPMFAVTPVNAGLVGWSGTSGAITNITALPNGTTATTQSAGDNSTKVATTAYVDATGAGTVTSVATNTGTGITGGTITSTGTLVIDTAGVIVNKTHLQNYTYSKAQSDARFAPLSGDGNYIANQFASKQSAKAWIDSLRATSNLQIGAADSISRITYSSTSGFVSPNRNTGAANVSSLDINSSGAVNRDINLYAKGSGQVNFMNGIVGFRLSTQNGPTYNYNSAGFAYRPPVEEMDRNFGIFRGGQWLFEGASTAIDTATTNWLFSMTPTGVRTGPRIAGVKPVNGYGSLEVWKRMVIGQHYLGHEIAADNGLSVEGFTSIGDTTTNGHQFKVKGTAYVTDSLIAEGNIYMSVNKSINSGSGRMVLNNGSMYFGDIDGINPSGALVLRRNGADVFNNNSGLTTLTGQLSVTQYLAGAAGTDSIVVHDNSSKKTKLISPAYYATSASPTFTGTVSSPITRLTNVTGVSGGTDSLLSKNATTNIVTKIPASYYAPASTYVPYIGATTDLTMGAHDIFAQLVSASRSTSGNYSGSFINTHATGNGAFIKGGGNASSGSAALLVQGYDGTSISKFTTDNITFTPQISAAGASFSGLITSSKTGNLLQGGNALTNNTFLSMQNTGGNVFLGRDDNTGSAFGVAYSTNLYSDGAYPTRIWSNGTVGLSMASNQVITLSSLGTGAVQATAGVLSVVSDSKAKDLHGKFKGSALTAINTLDVGQYWNYNSKSKLGENAYKVNQFGLLADKVHEKLGEEFAPTQGTYKDSKFIPTLIDGKETYGLSDRALLSLTIQALQEQQAIVKKQDARILKLEQLIIKK